MSLKDKWKNTGVSIGHAFKDFGKAMAKTASIAVGNESKVDENGNSKLKETWKTTGKDFGKAGKNIGVAAKGTADKVFGNGEKEEENKTIEKETIDLTEKPMIEEKKEEK